jgi:CheY-like chemotaxis protein
MPTALIVEDEPEANKLLGMLLRLRGYQPESAFTGEEALRVVTNSRLDIIFLDLMLPDLNGYEICKTLKYSKATSLIPVAIITARIADENRIESFCIGADDFIAKPFTPERIFHAVEQAAHWSEQCSAARIQASISFDRKDEGEILRRMGQFRSLLLARTALNLEAVVQIGRAVREVCNVADDWARGHPGDDSTTLTYELTARRLLLEFRGPSAWFAGLPLILEDPASEVSGARFDQTATDKAARLVKFVRDLPEI